MTAAIPPYSSTLRGRLAAAWQYVSQLEPARVQATVKGLLGIAVLIGISFPADLDGRVTALLGAVFGVLALWQGEATRARVIPVAKVAAAAAAIEGVEYDAARGELVRATPPE